jgi:hypothetical protein
MEYEEKWREVEKDQDGGQRRRSGRRSKADGERDFKGKRERGKGNNSSRRRERERSLRGAICSRSITVRSPQSGHP